MENEKNQFILKELELVTNRINVLVPNDVKLLNLLLIIFGIGLGFGISSKVFSDYLLIFFPIAIYSLLFYFIHLYIIIESLLGYKKSLEEYINRNFGVVILICELINENFHLKSKGLYFSYFGYSILMIFSIYLSISRAITVLSFLQTSFIILGHLIFLILLFISIFNLKSTFDKAYTFSNRKLGSNIKNKNR